MKATKKIVLFLSVVLILICNGCKGGTQKEISESMTMMVYMVGSDLEAATAAATNDMLEMEESGIDLSNVKLLIYTGGAPKWHNEKVEIPTDANAVYELTENGFTQVTEFEELSMGESESLTRFLQYGYDNYQSETYGLILWNHGNGPVIGYGSDLKYDKDVLTLPEIETALESSPFGEEEKLSFVGFDACLMASAELACVVDDYADYMIASQEVEPGFGWNYNFLAQCGKVDVPSLTEVIIEEYISYCEDYFTQHEFFKSDVTLAAVDLSYAKELETAIDALFLIASEDVSGAFNQLAYDRVQTRAFGRATTGSEYDLVDIQALMDSMGESYEEETKAVQEILDKMIVYSDANTSQSCGLSLYYPYYNKKYYQSSWKEDYGKLGLFSNYLTYLERYEQIWLGTDMKEAFEGKLVAEGGESGTYTLRLNESQAEYYVDGGYYILERLGEEVYSPIYYSKEVEHEDGVLTATFDGKVLYFEDDFGEQGIPVTTVLDRVDGETRYCAIGVLDNDAVTLEEYENLVCQIVMSVDPENDEVRVLDVSESTEDSLKTGKNPQIDLERWKQISFFKLKGRYLTRDESGQILPFDEWPENGWIIWDELYLADGLNFTFEPIYANGSEYFLMFDLMDAQGNSYSSELYPITLEEMPQEDVKVQTLGTLEEDSLEIFDRDGVKLYFELTKNVDTFEKEYSFRVENSNDFPVTVLIKDVMLEKNINVDGKTVYMSAEGNQSKTANVAFIKSACAMAGITQLKDMQFCVNMKDDFHKKTLVHEEYFSLEISKNIFVGLQYKPFMEAYASEQSLLKDPNGIQVDLLQMGTPSEDTSDSYSKLKMILRLENKTKAQKNVIVDVGLNGKQLAPEDAYLYQKKVVLEAGKVSYCIWEMSRQDITCLWGSDKISDVKVYLTSEESDKTITKELDVALSVPEKNVKRNVEAKINNSSEQTISEACIYDEDGVKLILKGSFDPEYATEKYVLLIENLNEELRNVEVREFVINNKLHINTNVWENLEAGQQKSVVLNELKRVMNLTEETAISSLQCQVRVQDENYEELESRQLKENFHKPLAPQIYFDTFLDSKAEEQVLRDDEKIKITLQGWGAIPGSDTKAIICFENKSNEQIPVHVSGLSLNGTFVEVNDSTRFLAPGERSYSYVTIIKSVMEETKLEAISEVEILLLTEEKENTGVVNYDGGSWYSVKLSEKSEAAVNRDKGVLLEKLGDVEIYLVSQSKKEYEYSKKVNYSWELEVINRSEENIEVSIEDIVRDGISQKELEVDEKNGSAYLASGDIGANTRRYTAINLFCTEELPRPELKFKFKIKSMAGGEILHSGNKTIVIAPEE